MTAVRPARGSKSSKRNSLFRRYGVPGLLAWASWPVTVALAILAFVVISWQVALVVLAVGILTGVVCVVTVLVRAARAGSKFVRDLSEETGTPWPGRSR